MLKSVQALAVRNNIEDMRANRVGSIKGSVWKLGMKQFSEGIAKRKPEITGGCVVVSVASLALTLLIMPFEISAGKMNNSANLDFFKEQIKVLKKLKKRLAEAADYDLRIFDDYRDLNAKEKPNAEKLRYKALIYAVESPMKAAALIKEGMMHAKVCLQFCRRNVLSDIKAASLLIYSSFEAILALAESNVAQLHDDDKMYFQQSFERLLVEGRKEGEELVEMVKNYYNTEI